VTLDGETNLMGYWEELEIFRCADGCQKLADEMLTEVKARYNAELKLNTAVTHIKLSTQGVDLLSKRVIKRDGTLAGGEAASLHYDYVILAIPPSVWAGVRISAITAADKEVAVNLDNEIGVMGMGDCVKFFSDMNERFWIKEKAAPYGGSMTLGQVWEGTDNQTRADPRVAKQGIVLSVFAGPIRTDSRGRARVPTRKEFTDGLTDLYPGYKDNLNKANRNNPLFSDWPHVPFIMTGYASPRINQIFDIGKKLSESFHGRLFFAGEHTQMAFFGYMEGALRSGERAANNVVLKSCGLLKEPAPASPSSPVRIASAAPIHERLAFEPESGILLGQHSSTGNPGETESPFLDRNFFATGVEGESEPRAAALASESPFLQLSAEAIEAEGFEAVEESEESSGSDEELENEDFGGEAEGDSWEG
jgi:hypothetical protein